MRSTRAAVFAALALLAFAAPPGRAHPEPATKAHPDPGRTETAHHRHAGAAHHHARKHAEAPKRHAAEPPRRHDHHKAEVKPTPKHHAAKTAAPKPKAAKKYVLPDPHKGTATGLPLPRFAALRSDEVNLRIGPGTRYPIEWVYKRRELPVEIEREFEVWRLVQDPDGVKGWVHQATLTGRRSFMVIGAEPTMRRRPDDKADPVARLKPGVVGRILHCDGGAEWCRVQAGDYRGWLKRQEFWGSLPGEAID